VFWQQREIYKYGVISNEKSTVVVDLPGSNILSGLVMQIRATNGSVAGDDFLQRNVKKVEVIADGSRELVSLDGSEIFLVGSVLSRYRVPGVFSLTSASEQWMYVPILFGRYMGDADYYLDCAKFSSLELRVTFDFTVGDTGIVDESLLFEVVGLMAMEGAPAPQRGFFKTSRKLYFTTAASGEKVIDLPRRNLYRKLAVAAIGDSIYVNSGIDRYQLDVNNAARILNVGTVNSLYQKNIIEYRYAAYETSVGNIVVFDFDVGDNMDNCLNSAAYDRVTLTLNQVSAGKDIRVLLQEVVS